MRFAISFSGARMRARVRMVRGSPMPVGVRRMPLTFARERSTCRATQRMSAAERAVNISRGTEVGAGL